MSFIMVKKHERLLYCCIKGRPETVVKCISKIYDILEKVPPKGSEQRYDPNCFDPSYDYGGTISEPSG